MRARSDRLDTGEGGDEGAELARRLGSRGVVDIARARQRQLKRQRLTRLEAWIGAQNAVQRAQQQRRRQQENESQTELGGDEPRTGALADPADTRPSPTAKRLE